MKHRSWSGNITSGTAGIGNKLNPGSDDLGRPSARFPLSQYLLIALLLIGCGGKQSPSKEQIEGCANGVVATGKSREHANQVCTCTFETITEKGPKTNEELMAIYRQCGVL